MRILNPDELKQVHGGCAPVTKCGGKGASKGKSNHGHSAHAKSNHGHSNHAKSKGKSNHAKCK
jgi:hypothetical protein